ncbi:DUF3784 domain-containing protein [Candidatus Contubernalis alkaliaceticus]|uniref:DUF3784 domain-containing protein n=1 Tax=Candidatus Contubernalis alkaliaceticus TaxID=338645 RepID=UPI001F4C0C0F|nr:DUF3784 domain-containing protein [Candidatus Contubernalis alkalaceticus]UNC92278.1 DUF3784 domain-containing protein [Candidatus Contubernalis alkalaceticus]
MIYFTAIFFAFLAIGVKYFKWYWLIAGYNTMPKKEKENVDKDGLANFIGNWLFVLAGLLVSLEVLPPYGNVSIIVFVVSFIMVITYMVVGAQKYIKSNEISKSDKIFNNARAGFAVIVGLIVLGLIFLGSRDPRVEITEHSLKFVPGSTVSLSKITEIQLKEEMPEVIKKKGGFDAGEIRRGRFLLEEMGAGTIYVHSSNQGPYIYIYHEDGFIIFQHRDQKKTEELYEYLKINL